MRLFGSKTSIFSSKSTAPGDTLGNLAEKFCFGNWGSILTYLLALSLRRKPRLDSSGEPISYSKQMENHAQLSYTKLIQIIMKSIKIAQTFSIHMSKRILEHSTTEQPTHRTTQRWRYKCGSDHIGVCTMHVASFIKN